jgi:hypothetical protein
MKSILNKGEKPKQAGGIIDTYLKWHFKIVFQEYEYSK